VAQGEGPEFKHQYHTHEKKYQWSQMQGGNKKKEFNSNFFLQTVNSGRMKAKARV
jgi:hypothetical protein